MKKLSLNAATFQKGEVLTRTQLKNILGGDGSGGSTGTCGTNTYDTHGTKVGETRGQTKTQAQDAAEAANLNHVQYCTPGCKYIIKWCCDSC